MAKKQIKDIDVAALQPDELHSLKEVMREFITRLSNIDNELETLRLDRKELIEEFSDKLDVKMLQLAMKIIKAESEVDRKGAYDTFKDLLKDDFS